MPQLIIHVILYCVITRYVDGTPTSEVTIRYIRPPHHGHTCQYHGHWSWMDDWHPFHSMSIGRPISEIRLFQTRTLTLQSQSHWCGQRVKVIQLARCWFNSLPFHFTSIRISDQQFLIQLFRNLTLEIQGQGHEWGQRSRSHIIPSIQPMHFLFVSHQSDQPFLRYGQNRVWPWKNTSKILKENLPK